METALRIALVGAVAVAVTLARASWGPWVAGTALVLTALLTDRPTSVLVIGSLALWVAVSGRAGLPGDSRPPTGAPAAGLIATATATLFAGNLVVPLGLLTTTWVMTWWLTTTQATPRWAAALDHWTRMAASSIKQRTSLRADTDRDQAPGPILDEFATGSTDLPTRRGILTPVLAWTGTAVLASWIQTVAVRTAEYGVSVSTLLPFPSPTSGKGGWDTLYYINIAQNGYVLPASQDFTSRPASDLVAYFPGYPLAIRAVAALPGIDEPLASILIALVGGLAATILFWVWMCDRGISLRHRRTALALFLLYPYSFMLTGVAYAEPMTLALVLGAFVLFERDRHLLAGVIAAAATFTRPTALPVLLALPVLALERGGSLRLWTSQRVGDPPARSAADRRVDQDPRNSPESTGPRPLANSPHVMLEGRSVLGDLYRRWGALLGGAGVGTFAIWLITKGRSPLAFWSVQSNYGQDSAWRLETWLKVDFIRSLPRMGWGAETVNRLAAAAATVVSALSIPAVARRFGIAYAVFVAGLVGTVLLGARFFSPGGRYLSLAFPVVAILGVVLARRPGLRAVVLFALGTGWVLLTWRFARTQSLGW